MHLQKQKSDREIILAEWQTCVQMADSVSRRRDTTNHLFLTLNLAILATSLWGLDEYISLVFGFFLCLLWITFIIDYKNLNKAKFEIICKLEEHLPVTPFKSELEKIQKHNQYKELTSLEVFIPSIFAFLYAITLVILLINEYIL